MIPTTWVLTDVSKDIHEPELMVSAHDVKGAPRDFRIVKRTLRGGLSDGVDEIRIHNGLFEFSILPTRGMSLWRGWMGEQVIGWQSPIQGPVHPRFVPQSEPTGLGFLDGFDEWICRCGAVSNGAPDFDDHGRLAFALHGHIANLPAHFVHVSITGDRIVVRGIVDECRFHFRKLRLTTTLTTRFGQPGLEIHDELQNLSGSATDAQMLYHCNFGVPMLSAGAEVVLPASKIVPCNDWAAEGLESWATFSEPTPGMEERVYFFQMLADSNNETGALLKSADNQHGVSLSWNVKQLPCFTLWKNETSLRDGYVTGLEPASNLPNPRRFETAQGRVIPLQPGQSHEMRVGITVHPDADSVESARQEINRIQAGRALERVARPQSDWCAESRPFE